MFAPNTLKLFLFFFILLYHYCPQVQIVEKAVKRVILCFVHYYHNEVYSYISIF